MKNKITEKITETNTDKSGPIFKSVFGADWNSLPRVLLDHYANRGFSTDVVVAEGIMSVKLSKLMLIFAPLFAFTKTLIPKQGSDVAVTVKFRSDPDSNMFCLDRQFRFGDGQNFKFVSNMQPVGGNQVIEWTQSGIGWLAAFTFENEKIVLAHRGYCIKVFGQRYKIPISFLVGHSSATEWALNDREFAMEMSIQHWLFGQIYAYEGKFAITEISFKELGQ